MRKIILFAQAILVLVLFNNQNFPSSQVELSGSTFYVSKTGSSFGSGTFEDPFLKISDAIGNASYGDQIVVLPGIYEENIEIGTGITLTSSGIEPAIIQSTDEQTMISIGTSSTIEGFVIIQRNNGTVIYAEGTNIIIRNNEIICEVSENPGTAIGCLNSSVEISRNYISSFYVGIHGIGGINTNTVGQINIHNNIIEAFSCISFNDDVKSDIINNTIIFGNSKGEYGKGIETRFSDYLNVTNNIFISAFGQSGVAISNDGSSTTTINSSYNNFWNHEIKYKGNVNELAGCLNVDPVFIDFPSKDYNLQEDSFCRNAGNPNILYNDLDSTRNDLGAYGGPTPFIDKNNLQVIKKLSLGNCSGFPGDTIRTRLQLETPENLYKGEVTIEYDDEIISFYEVNKTKATENFTINTKINSSQITITLEGNVESDFDDNSILEMTFLVNDNSKSGNASPLIIKNVSFYDKVLNNIFLTSKKDGVFITALGNNSGNYIYVNINGGENPDGTRYKPFASLQEAIDFSTAGDTIIVAPGKYFGPFIMKDSIYLQGSGPSITELDIDFDLYLDTPVIRFDAVDNSTITGFTINSKEISESAGIFLYNSSPQIIDNFFKAPFINANAVAIFCNNESNPIIKRNKTENCAISLSTSAPIIQNNIISGSEGGFASIIINSNSNPFISKNKIYSTEAGDGIAILNSKAVIENNYIVPKTISNGIYISESDSCIIRNNIFYDDGNNGNGIFLRKSNQIKIINNTFSTGENGVWAITSTGSIQNNIITGNNVSGINAPDFIDINYNCLWNNQIDYEGTFNGPNDLFIDPEFLENSLFLSENSPCVNYGNPSPEYNDKDGTRNDLGAWGGLYADLDWTINESSSLEILSNSEYEGDSIYVDVIASNIKNISNIDLSLSFDNNVLEFLNAASTDITKTFSMEKSNQYSGLVSLKMESSVGIEKDSGNVSTLIFLNKAQNSTRTSIKFSNVSLLDYILSKRNISGLKDGEFNIVVTGLSGNDIPQKFSLAQNYPNPFNPVTTINYSLAKTSIVELAIFDILGRRVKTLVNEEKPSGEYKIEFNANNLSSGVYFYKIKAGNFVKTKKMLLMK